jgi:hypothetical protein
MPSRQPLAEDRRMEQEMATPIQNEARVGPPVNVLSKESHPNTLGGIGVPAAASVRLPVSVLVAAAILLLVAVALVVVR